MASKDGSKSYIKIFLIVFGLLLLLSVSISLLYQSSRPPTPLPEASLESKLVREEFKRPDGSTYFIDYIQSTNLSKDDLYSCKSYLVAAGTTDEYLGFTSNYTEKNCKPLQTGKTQYDCILSNWLHRYQNFDNSTSFRKLAPNSSYKIPVNSFYLETTPPNINFQSKNQLSDIFSVKHICYLDSGTKVSHIQLLRK